MKTLRNFGTFSVEGEYRSLDEIPKLVSFRGEPWSAAIYDPNPGPYDVVLHYEKILPEFRENFIPTEILGLEKPREIECNCGLKYTFMNGVKEAHSEWCRVITEDPWNFPG